jgi:hypothetical protein
MLRSGSIGAFPPSFLWYLDKVEGGLWSFVVYPSWSGGWSSSYVFKMGFEGLGWHQPSGVSPWLDTTSLSYDVATVGGFVHCPIALVGVSFMFRVGGWGWELVFLVPSPVLLNFPLDLLLCVYALFVDLHGLL